MAMFGKIALPPDGTHFILIAMIVVASIVGKIFTLVGLPALLGMLLTGIGLKNLPGVTFDEHWQANSLFLSNTIL
jgi:Kef-type K+ transport system membrane component KefB